MRKATLLLAAFLAACGGKSSAPNASADWPMYNRDYSSTRFSGLTDIAPKNVSGLHAVCSYVLPEKVMFESGLVAVNGTMYFTTFEYTYAIDAATCALRWRSKHELPTPPGVGSTRGVALADNRVFRGSADGYVTAYDASNGNQAWSTKITAEGSMEYISESPIAWNGIVFIGTAGADAGNIGRIDALDAASGRVLWSFPLIPTGAEANADSWPKGTHLAGGSSWTSLTLDPDSGALYAPTGNPGPDFAGTYRPGANLYAGGVVVLDAKSGALRTWYQLVPHDVHDWDIAAAPVLITTKAGLRRLMAAGKDGLLHAVDLGSGKELWKTPVTTIENVDAPLTSQGTRFCPGTTGGVEWNGPAYSANSNLVYVNSTDWCTTIKMDPKPPKFEPGKSFTGAANGFGTMDPTKRGWVTAVDADSGAVQWRYQAATPMVAGIVATASNLVMTADLNGDFFAFDATTGSVVHKMGIGQPAGGGVITYEQGGQQRIALAAGLESRIFRIMGQPTILVFGL